MSFKRRKIIYINNLEEMNHYLKYCERYLINLSREQVELANLDPKSKYYQIEIKPTQIELSFYTTTKGYETNIFKLDGSNPTKHLNGLEAFSMLQRMSKKGVVDLTKTPLYNEEIKDFDLPTIGGINYINSNFINKRIEHVYAYDLNSAYSWAMTLPIPDTKGEIDYSRKINKGEIGFIIKTDKYTFSEKLFAVFEEGKYADYIFKAIESPFIKFVEHFYKGKSEAKDSETKQYYKDMLNICTGYIRRKNPFIHSCIVSRVRDKIESSKDENTILCNNDSIISLTKRDDLELGNNYGQFKLERENQTIAITKSGYQWNFELPKIRGKSKQWFKNKFPNGYDILKDGLPHVEANKYIFNQETYQIEVNINYEN